MRKSMGECSNRQNDAGAAAVEFALIATIFVTLLLGVIQFGWTFFEYIQVAHAAREGVRWAALGQNAQVQTRALQAAPALDPGRVNVSISAGSSTDAVRVTVSYTRTNLVPLPPGIALPAVITSVAEEREE